MQGAGLALILGRTNSNSRIYSKILGQEGGAIKEP
jgi:hypothetical protein